MKVSNFDPKKKGTIAQAAREAYYTLRPNRPEVLLINTEDWYIIKDEYLYLMGVSISDDVKQKAFGLRVVPSDAIEQGTFEIY